MLCWCAPSRQFGKRPKVHKLGYTATNVPLLEPNSATMLCHEILRLVLFVKNPRLSCKIWKRPVRHDSTAGDIDEDIDTGEDVFRDKISQVATGKGQYFASEIERLSVANNEDVSTTPTKTPPSPPNLNVGFSIFRDCTCEILSGKTSRFFG